MDPITIIMAVAALGSGIVSGISAVSSAKSQAKLVKQQAEYQRDQTAKKARIAMSEQKNSYLKSGVYFTGTPETVVTDTYDTYKSDVNQIVKNANTNIKGLQRQANYSFISNIAAGVAAAATGLAGAGAFSSAASGASSGTGGIQYSLLNNMGYYNSSSSISGLGNSYNTANSLLGYSTSSGSSSIWNYGNSSSGIYSSLYGI